MRFAIEDLRKYQEKHLLTCKKHPTEDLYLWNYTPEVQYDNLWDDITKQCRGLITDSLGNVKVRCLQKFFNLGQSTESNVDNLPQSNPVITEKLDGSCGLQYYINDKPYIATRGSFESEQAIWATEWIQQKFKTSSFLDGYTYIYEIVAPWNRIVVFYPVAELKLIAVINNETGDELDHVAEAQRLGIGYAKVINKSLHELIPYLQVMKSDEEGFVARYPNGLRVKMKGEEYLRLHRLVTGFSSRSVWECMMKGQNIQDVMYAVPDEFYNWIKEVEHRIQENYNMLWINAQTAYLEVKELATQKDKALVLMSKYKNVSGIVFAMLKGKDATSIIWKMIEPEYEIPFKKDTDL